MSDRVVRMLDGTEAQGMGVVLAVLEHAETEPPRPWTVTCSEGQLMDGEGAVWTVDGGQAVRLLALACQCGCTELTTYKDGVEISRFVGVR
ncbi:hypothetical protein ABT093_20830 [Kitasatospora sp. NPDC002551]|uniref:hypothetical protein n=1 Tax=Kitasatospora sp. NPDC002551 TaxID=3154539 RepID=UPI003328432C